VRHPALVLGAHLPGSVDAAHPQHAGGQVEAAGVVQDVLVRRALGAAVRGVEIQPPALVHAVEADRRVAGQVAVVDDLQRHVGQVAIDLVGAGEDQRRAAALAAKGFQHVDRAADVDLEVGDRIGQAGGHRHLGGQVEYGHGVADGAVHGLGVANVADLGADPAGMARLQPGQVAIDARPGQGVEDDDVMAVGGQAIGQVGADEPGAAGDQDGTRCGAHATRPRISSSLRASTTRSSLSWRATHSASSASPSPKFSLAA
jgi:hypothetical protein